VINIHNPGLSHENPPTPPQDLKGSFVKGELKSTSGGRGAPPCG